eukprot:9412532-Alexandrium_andersonii.AAC.1
MRADLRVPISGLVTVSDASMRKGAVCRSVRLTDAGRAAARAAQRPLAAASVDKVTLASLFDGIGGAVQALRLAG